MKFRSYRLLKVFSAAIAVLSFGAVLGCQGVTAAQNSGSVNPTSEIRTTISPTQATVQAGLSQQFSAVVNGTANTGVTWLVNGAAGGNQTVGTMSSSGLYAAPQVAPATPVTVTARSVADTTSSAASTVTVVPPAPPIEVSISPNRASLSGNQTQQFTATVTGTSNTAVDWSVDNVPGGNASLGTISSTGLYTAPACPSQSDVTVSATSAYDSSASANAAATISAGGGNGDYYVEADGSDSNSGSACSPWATISFADSVVTPGSTVHIAPGIYHMNVTTSKSGTATAPIRYISDTQWGAKIVGDADSVWLNTGSYVMIEGLDITASNPDTRQGILSYGPHCQILGNRVHDIQAVSGRNGNGGAGISPNNDGSQAADYTIVSGNIVYNIAQGASTIYVQGIYVNGSKYNVVSNNLIFQCGGWGIQQWHTGVGHMTAINNTIFDCHGGILIGSGDTRNPSDHNFIANNIIYHNTHNSGGDGIYECCYSSNSGVGTHQTYTNNLLYQNTPANTSLQWSGDKATNTVAANPLFVNYTGDQNGNYQLHSGSPAINAGTSTYAPKLSIDGGSRPVGGAWDIGAYEYAAGTGKWSWF